MPPHRLFILTLTLTLFAPPLHAQTGILQGRIASAGAPVPLADLQVIRLDGFSGRRSVSAADGSFRVAFLPPGSYRLKVRRIGLRPVLLCVLVNCSCQLVSTTIILA